MRRTWIKLFCDQWLRGSIRKEPVEVRAVFADLLTMAGDSAFGDPNIAANGTVQLADDVGFTDEAIASILNVPLKTWGSAKRRLCNHPEPEENRIEIIPLPQGFGIRILNWTRYQSEYSRQRKYRGPKSPPIPPSLRNINIEGEGEGEGKVTPPVTPLVTEVTDKVTTEVINNKLPPIPKNTAFKIKDDLEKLRLDILELETLLQDERKIRMGGYDEPALRRRLEEMKSEYCRVIKELNDARE